MLEAKIWECTREVYKTVVKASKLALLLSEESRNTGRPLVSPATTEAVSRMLNHLKQQSKRTASQDV